MAGIELDAREAPTNKRNNLCPQRSWRVAEKVDSELIIINVAINMQMCRVLWKNGRRVLNYFGKFEEMILKLKPEE